ncbi:Ser-Asp rich fibrinogen/bone sialoprotein-binding protein SdrD [Staphylococcus aureus]|uniref:SdrD B-like domain-containing protein n=1 Tax=Staphylococcus aureus TaxID=1280 RepID=UPI000DF8EF7D|nr:SdrD B-like domain-containing protein [Staphylococcus aureus]SUK67285.1 Ser-Asp rich fibrinogen/bone sialoprotein-binding protein SdrD [Staphylococcus aureus]
MKASHQGGLSPNKQNKYSIRKYTVGTASLLIGTTLIFGVHAKDASAAEEVAKQTQLAEEKTEDTAEATGESDSDLIPEVPTQDTNQDNAIEDLPEEGATSEKAVNNAEQTQQDENLAEKQQGEDKASSKTQPTPTEKSAENEEAATVDENKEQQATVAERKAVVSQPQETEKSNATNTTPTTTESTPQPKQLAETMKQVTALEDNQEKEAKLVDYYSKNAGVNSETAKQVVQGMNLDYQNLDSDQLTAEMLIALANKQEQNTPKATPVSLRSPKNLMRAVTLGDAEPQNSNVSGTSKNVNDLITSDFKITVNSNKDGKVVPGQSTITLVGNVNVNDKVKPGDYFTVKYSDAIQVYGVNPEDIKNIGDIFDKKNGEKIVTAVHDTKNNLITYTFTDYVNRFSSVKMNFDYTLFLDPTKLPENKANLPLSVTIGKNSKTVNTDITYPGYTVGKDNSLGTSFTEAISHVGDAQNPGHYIQTVYVNPLDKNLKNVNLKVFVDHQNFPNNIGQINDKATDLKIYKAPKGYTLSKGYSIDTSKLTDVTKDYSPAYSADDQVTVNFKDIDSPYVVVVNTKFKPTVSENPTLVQMARLSSNNNTTIQTGNGLGFTNNTSAGASDGEKVYKVGNYVWEDQNKDGIQNEKGTGISGVEVKLIDKSTNQIIQTKTTSENGSYLFENVKNGEYIIKFETPNGYVSTNKNQGGDNALDSDGTEVVVTVNNADNLTIDSGFYKPVYKLGDKVWNDLNKDGVQDDNEPGISDVKVTLKNKAGQELKVTKTNKDGKYEFTDLPNGEYQVDFETPAGYVPTIKNTKDDTKDSDGPLKAEGIISNGDNFTVDQGFYKKEEPKYHVGDKVWEDTNKDGIQQDSESGISGVKVTLKGKDGETIETKATDDQGKYLFENVTKGEYTIEFETPEGYKPTEIGKGDADKDSNGTSAKVTVDKDDITIDSGFYKPTYSLGDKVWEDTNKNGIQDEDEKGIKGVKVTLKDSTGEELDTTVTNDKGEYEFKDLPNGEYEVDFETPEGYVPTVANKEDDTKDSDGPLNAKGVIKDEDNLTVDQGFYKKEEPPVQKPATYKVGDKVWHDTNKDGIQNVNEPGISGVTVTLKQPDGTLITTKTDKDGNYIFKDLPNGKYEISFETPEGYEATAEKAGDDRRLDSDGKTVTVEVNNADDLTIDSGFYKKEEPPVQKPATYKVGDKVWHDTNKDGIQNVNEPGISGVTVTLKQPDGTLITTKTDKDGNYIFKDLPNGKYEISFETPEGYEATAEKAGDDRRLDSDGKTVTVEVNNADDLTIDSGFYKKEEPPVQKPATYKVGDKVWHDTNKDGIQNVNEPGISGVTVTLKQPDGTLITTKTDKDGNYIFKDLPNGKYEISFETPEGYEATAEKAGDDRRLDSDGKTVTVEVNNADDLTIDSGFYKKEEPPVQKPATYKVGDKVWHDTNKDGIQNVNEPGISGVTVTLKQPDGTLITTKTDKDGNYIFKDLPNGKYEISFETPEGYEATAEKAGDDRRLDSDGKTVTVEVNNADDLTIDSGFYKKEEPPVQKPATYKVGDKVWHDTNKDGIQNVNEPGISGVTVTLKQPDGTLITTKTDKDGNYIFKDLPNGKYEISFETPEGYEATTANVGDDALDSDGKTVAVEVNNADDLTIDSGFYKPVVEPPKTDATYKVGDKVWNDTNKDGIQNANEAGIEGVKVTLTKADGTTVETRTDKDGNYIFTDLPNGKYEISFETPEGYEATTENVGDDALDSDGTKVEVEVNNADDLTIDSGFYKPVVEPPKTDATYKVGDKVWNDTNKDGIQNANEAGIEGVKVTLTKADGTTVETRTDKDGNYIFTDLPNGKYEISFETPEGYEATTENVGDDALDSDGTKVEVEVNNADDLTIDSGFYKPVVEPPKTDATYKVGDKVWNDTNKDGIQNANEAGIEGVKVTLTKADGTTVETRTDKDGNYIFTDLPNGKYEISFETPEGYEATTENVGDDALDSDGTKVEVEVNNADDLTIDSGFYKPVVEPPKTDATYKVGDKVWNDTNKDGIQNANEAGIEGVKVTLTKADGTTVETRTDKDGNYIFTGLPNGKYEISFETPEGYEATTANVGDDALDSDGTKVEVEVNNADDLTIDSGFYKPTPEVPAPEVPEQPGNPEVPAPEVPEQPGNPEVPTPEVPEQPGNPEVPTPEVPEQPGNPETPAPEVPEQPGNPEVPTPEQPGQPKVEKAMPSTPQKAESKHKKETLPETGQENAGQTTLLGSLFAALGGAFLLGRRRKDKKEQ